MADERTTEELIDEFDHLQMKMQHLQVGISGYEGLRQIGGPVPKSNEQKIMEMKREDTLELLKTLRERIKHRLGLNLDASNMSMGDFSDFLLVNFKVEDNEVTLKKDSFLLPPIPPNELRAAAQEKDERKGRKVLF